MSDEPPDDSNNSTDKTETVITEKEVAEYNRHSGDKEQIVEISPKGRFVRFNECIGAGAYKTVYRGYDEETGREVAWNVVNIARLPASERKRITEEINIIRGMKHPNIIHFIGAWLNKQREEVVFITEIVTGGALRQYIQRIKHPRLRIIKSWCQQILEGLSYLHNQKPHPIIHRDLKCDNIFINANSGDIRIGDLGLSTSMKQSHAASVLGTPEFMAPELYEENYGTAVDIYAFGMCVLEMCTLEYPYAECSNPAQIYKKVTRGEKPAVLDRIKQESVREFIDLCIRPALERPSAEELLRHPFLTEISPADNKPVEMLTEETVREHRSSLGTPDIRLSQTRFSESEDAQTVSNQKSTQPEPKREPSSAASTVVLNGKSPAPLSIVPALQTDRPDLPSPNRQPARDSIIAPIPISAHVQQQIQLLPKLEGGGMEVSPAVSPAVSPPTVVIEEVTEADQEDEDTPGAHQAESNVKQVLSPVSNPEIYEPPSPPTLEEAALVRPLQRSSSYPVAHTEVHDLEADKRTLTGEVSRLSHKGLVDHHGHPVDMQKLTSSNITVNMDQGWHPKNSNRNFVKLKLKLHYRGAHKEIIFDFDLSLDTPEGVATEMIRELCLPTSERTRIIQDIEKLVSKCRRRIVEYSNRGQSGSTDYTPHGYPGSSYPSSRPESMRDLIEHEAGFHLGRAASASVLDREREREREQIYLSHHPEEDHHHFALPPSSSVASSAMHGHLSPSEEERMHRKRSDSSSTSSSHHMPQGPLHSSFHGYSYPHHPHPHPHPSSFYSPYLDPHSAAMSPQAMLPPLAKPLHHYHRGSDPLPHTYLPHEVSGPSPVSSSSGVNTTAAPSPTYIHHTHHMPYTSSSSQGSVYHEFHDYLPTSGSHDHPPYTAFRRDDSIVNIPVAVPSLIHTTDTNVMSPMSERIEHDDVPPELSRREIDSDKELEDMKLLARKHQEELLRLQEMHRREKEMLKQKRKVKGSKTSNGVQYHDITLEARTQAERLANRRKAESLETSSDDESTDAPLSPTLSSLPATVSSRSLRDVEHTDMTDRDRERYLERELHRLEQPLPILAVPRGPPSPVGKRKPVIEEVSSPRRRADSSDEDLISSDHFLSHSPVLPTAVLAAGFSGKVQSRHSTPPTPSSTPIPEQYTKPKRSPDFGLSLGQPETLLPPQVVPADWTPSDFRRHMEPSSPSLFLANPGEPGATTPHWGTDKVESLEEERRRLLLAGGLPPIPHGEPLPPATVNKKFGDTSPLQTQPSHHHFSVPSKFKSESSPAVIPHLVTPVPRSPPTTSGSSQAKPPASSVAPSSNPNESDLSAEHVLTLPAGDASSQASSAETLPQMTRSISAAMSDVSQRSSTASNPSSPSLNASSMSPMSPPPQSSPILSPTAIDQGFFSGHFVVSDPADGVASTPGIVIKEVEGDATSTHEPVVRSPLKLGQDQHEEDVKVLQYKLHMLLPDAPLTVDGVFGDSTEAAVKSFQEKNNLEANGFVDETVWNAVNAEYATKLRKAKQTERLRMEYQQRAKEQKRREAVLRAQQEKEQRKKAQNQVADTKRLEIEANILQGLSHAPRHGHDDGHVHAHGVTLPSSQFATVTGVTTSSSAALKPVSSVSFTQFHSAPSRSVSAPPAPAPTVVLPLNHVNPSSPSPREASS